MKYKKEGSLPKMVKLLLACCWDRGTGNPLSQGVTLPITIPWGSRPRANLMVGVGIGENLSSPVTAFCRSVTISVCYSFLWFCTGLKKLATGCCWLGLFFVWFVFCIEKLFGGKDIACWSGKDVKISPIQVQRNKIQKYKGTKGVVADNIVPVRGLRGD